MIPLRVLGDRILVQPDEDRNAPQLLASGIHIAKTLSAAVTGEDKTTSVQRGTVIAVGTPKHPLKAEAESLALTLQMRDDLEAYHSRFPREETPLRDASHLLRDLVRREPVVAVGDDVLFNHDAGQLITLENQSYIILREAELLAVVEPEGAYV